MSRPLSHIGTDCKRIKTPFIQSFPRSEPLHFTVNINKTSFTNAKTFRNDEHGTPPSYRSSHFDPHEHLEEWREASKRAFTILRFKGTASTLDGAGVTKENCTFRTASPSTRRTGNPTRASRVEGDGCGIAKIISGRLAKSTGKSLTG